MISEESGESEGRSQIDHTITKAWSCLFSKVEYLTYAFEKHPSREKECSLSRDKEKRKTSFSFDS